MTFGSFGSLRKKRQDESEEYVCPMDVEMPKGRSFQKGYELYEDDLDRLEQVNFWFGPRSVFAVLHNSYADCSPRILARHFSVVVALCSVHISCPNNK
jgi:hypothetical protein